MKVFALMGMAAILETSAGFGADFSSWMDSTRVLLNTTPSGADVATDQNSFPVLVRLTAADFIFSEAKSDGSDLRFADSTGGDLPYQLERFDPINKLAEAWVLLPVVRGNSAVQWFRMYWGNPSAASTSSGPAVFPAAGNYTGVWHLSENGGAAAGAFKDASSLGNHGTGVALGGTSAVTGAVGAATNFVAASSQGISVPFNASLHASGNLTVEAWIKSTSQDSYKRYLGRPFSSVAAPWNEYSLESDITGGKATFSLTVADSQASIIATTVMANGTWYHVVGTYDGAMQKIYINGVLENSHARTGAVSDYGQALAIGKYALDANSNFDGAVDEARISKAARGADWIKLGYANQKAGQKLISYQRFPSCQMQFSVPADTALDEGGVLQLTAKAVCASDYFWTAVSGPAPRLLDPEVKVLQVVMPRVQHDTMIVYRFTADFPDSTRAGNVKVTLKEAIPDPAFTLPASPTWTGAAPLVIKPTVTNAAAIAASKAPTLHYAWTLAGVPVDSAYGPDFISLSRPTQNGNLTVGLCLDNGGTVLCHETTASVAVPVALLPRAAGMAFAQGDKSGWDAEGRFKPGKKRSGILERAAP